MCVCVCVHECDTMKNAEYMMLSTISITVIMIIVV